jgi:hypothetical protein
MPGMGKVGNILSPVQQAFSLRNRGGPDAARAPSNAAFRVAETGLPPLHGNGAALDPGRQLVSREQRWKVGL